MRRITVFVLGVVLSASFSVSAQAFMRKDMSLVKGKVVQHDVKKAVLTVAGERGEGNVVFDISAAEITTSLAQGERVVVIYKIDGNKVTIVKPVPPGR